jgi:hypothetical protein
MYPNKYIFICRYCEFATDRLYNISRHTKTKKHIKNYEKDPNKEFTEDDKDRIIGQKENKKMIRHLEFTRRLLNTIDFLLDMHGY